MQKSADYRVISIFAQRGEGGGGEAFLQQACALFIGGSAGWRVKMLNMCRMRVTATVTTLPVQVRL